MSNILGIIFFVNTLFLHETLHAKKRDYKTQTIGDIFQKIEKKAEYKKLKKQKTIIPKLKADRRSKVKKSELYSIKPPKSSRFIKGNSKEAELERYTDQEIKQLYKLTQQYRRSKRRGEIWLRLAEAYVGKAKIVEYRLQNDYNNKIDAYKSGKRKKRPRLNLNPAINYNKKAIKLYELFLMDFPNDSKVDQAYFFLGYNYFELNQVKKALDYYDKLTKFYPKSKYAGEAYFALGEYYFDNEKWKTAITPYTKVANDKNSRLHSFSLYKLAWCYYKSGNTKKAIGNLERVIREAREGGADADRKIRLADEAKKDLIPFFAELGAYKNASQYFAKVVPSSEVDKMIERLAYYFSDSGNKKGARHYFKKLIQKNPNAPKAFEYQNQIVNMYLNDMKSKIFKEELYHWVEYYGPSGRWSGKNKETPELIKRSTELVEATLRSYVLQNHQTAQNSRGQFSINAALSGYELYFKSLKNVPQLGDMHFFYGELLFDLKKYKEAAQNYIWVAKNDKKNKYFEKALLNAILALEKNLPSDKEIEKIVGKSKAKVPLDRTTKVFAEAASQYIKELPKANNVVDIKYKLANLYYSYNHIDEALQVFNDIVKNHASSKYAPSSGHLILDLYNKKNDYLALEKAASGMLAIPAIANAKFGTEVKNILQRSTFKQAQDLETQKEFIKSAKAYENFAVKYKQSKLKTSARFNAAVNYERSGQIGKAISMYILVVKEGALTNKDLVIESRKILAHLFEISGQFKKAAEYYEKSAIENRKNKIGADFYFNAAVLREGMRYYKAAIRNYEQYLKLTKNKNKEEAYYFIAEIWKKRKDLRNSIKFYEKYLNSHPKNPDFVVKASFEVAHINEKLKNIKLALNWFKKTIDAYRILRKKVSSEIVNYAAESQFKLSYEIYKKLRSIKIPKNTSLQQKAVEKKINLIKQLTNELKKTIKYNVGDQIVASMSLIAQSYQHMMAATLTAPLPQGLSLDETKAYKIEIRKVAEKFRAESIKNYQAAIQKGYEFEAYGKWLKASLLNLNNISPGIIKGFEFNAYIARLPDLLDRKKAQSKAPVAHIDDLYRKKEKGVESEVVKSAARILLVHGNDLYTLNALAMFYYNKGYYGLSKIIIDRILEEHPNEPSAYNNLGVIFLSEGNMKKALINFRQALKLNPDYQIASANIGSIYIEYLDFKKSHDPLSKGYTVIESKLTKGDVNAIKVANNYAISLFGRDQAEKSRGVLKRLIDMGSRDDQVLVNYASLLINHLKEPDEGLKIISKLKFVTDDKNILKIAKDLEEKAYDQDKK